jgi:hypothetical protein
MSITNDQLSQFLEILRIDLINSLQANNVDATGQTAKELITVMDNNSVRLLVPGYMQLLETGRGPTGANAVQGDPPMIQRIQQWCQEKGIPDKAAWAIKKSIDKKGYKGKPGIITAPLGDDNINLRLEPFLEAIADGLTDQLIDLVD